MRRDACLRLALAVCASAIGTAAFAQGTPEQREACTPDALKLCTATIPDVARTTACMKAHRAELSPRCQAAMDVETPSHAKPEPARDAAPDEAATRRRPRPTMRNVERIERDEYIVRRDLPRFARDPDAEIPYMPPRRVIAPPIYSDPGPPLNPNGVPYDDLFASPYPFDIPDVFIRPASPYAD